jgi:hypothetical protein
MYVESNVPIHATVQWTTLFPKNCISSFIFVTLPFNFQFLVKLDPVYTKSEITYFKINFLINRYGMVIFIYSISRPQLLGVRWHQNTKGHLTETHPIKIIETCGGVGQEVGVLFAVDGDVIRRVLWSVGSEIVHMYVKRLDLKNPYSQVGKRQIAEWQNVQRQFKVGRYGNCRKKYLLKKYLLKKYLLKKHLLKKYLLKNNCWTSPEGSTSSLGTSEKLSILITVSLRSWIHTYIPTDISMYIALFHTKLSRKLIPLAGELWPLWANTLWYYFASKRTPVIEWPIKN